MEKTNEEFRKLKADYKKLEDLLHLLLFRKPLPKLPKKQHNNKFQELATKVKTKFQNLNLTKKVKHHNNINKQEMVARIEVKDK